MTLEGFEPSLHSGNRNLNPMRPSNFATEPYKNRKTPREGIEPPPPFGGPRFSKPVRYRSLTRH